MYKEKMTGIRAYFSREVGLLLALVCVPTLILSRQRFSDQEVSLSQTQQPRVTGKKTIKKVKSLPKKESKPAGVKVAQGGKEKENPASQKEERRPQQLVNQIAVLIYTNVPSQSGSDSKEFEKAPDVVLTQLDVERRSIDGRKRTVEELVMDQLMYCEAIYFYRMVVPEDAVDKYINSIKEQHHLSDDQLRMMFKEVGYTYEEGRHQLAMGQAIDSLLNFKIRSRLVVLEKDVRDYYDAHPAYEEASYKIKKGFIPEGIFTEEELKNCTDEMMKNPAIQWSTSYWLLEDEITDERKEMLRGMAQGSYSPVETATGGYEIIRLLNVKPRALKSFEDRYREISSILQEPHYYQLLDELKKELLEKYEVVYFN
jgi:hypothetical protein